MRIRELIMGVIDSETKEEISTAPATTIPNSRKSLPVMPSMKMMGRKTLARVIVVEMIAKKTSRDPLNPA